MSGWESDFPSVNAWFSALSGRPEFQAGVQYLCKGGDMTLLKTSLTKQPEPRKVQEASTSQKPQVQKQSSKPVKEEVSHV